MMRLCQPMIKLQNNNKDTFIHIAAAQGHTEIVMVWMKELNISCYLFNYFKRYFFQLASYNLQQNEDGNDPFLLAVLHGHVEIVRRLLHSGVISTRHNKEGLFALRILHFLALIILLVYLYE